MRSEGFSAVGVSSTYRCSAYQDQLFAQGRTRPGNIVTNARGGESIHNFRLAFDFFQNIRGQEWNNAAFFAEGGRIWRGMGGVWGGDWASFRDRTHCEFTGGLSLRDLQGGRRLAQDATMPWEAARPKSEPTPPVPALFPLSQENLAAMSALGVMNSPEYWRNVTSVRYLDNLLDNVRRRNLMDSAVDNGNGSFDTALEILQAAGVITDPAYWRNAVSSGEVPHLDTLIINISKRSRIGS